MIWDMKVVMFGWQPEIVFSNFHNKHLNNWRWWDEIFLCETVANGLISVENKNIFFVLNCKIWIKAFFKKTNSIFPQNIKKNMRTHHCGLRINAYTYKCGARMWCVEYFIIWTFSKKGIGLMNFFWSRKPTDNSTK